MRPRTVIADIVGLAGCVAVGWGVRGAMALVIPIGGSCGGDSGQSCPPGTGTYAIGLAVGVLLVAAATVAGGVLAGRALFVAIGVGALLAAKAVGDGQQAFPLIFGFGFLAGGLISLALIPRAFARRRRAMRLVETGTLAVGTVLDVTDTGVEINGNPRVRVSYRIEPQDGTAVFQGVKTMVVSKLAPPRAGERRPIYFDPADRTSFAIVERVTDDAPEPVRRLAAQISMPVVPAGGGTPAPAAPMGTGLTGSEPGAYDQVSRLAKLAELHRAGDLTDSEFQAMKARILNGG